MEDMTFFTFGASICAGIAATCLIIVIFDLLEFLHLEKEMKMETKHLPVFIKLFMPFVSNAIPLVRYPLFDQTRKSTEEMILMAGYDQAITANEFIAVRILSGIVGFLVMIAFFASGNALSGMLMVMVMLIYPGIWLKNTIKRRHLEILKALPNVLDLLTLSVEAGKDFLTSLRDILLRRRMDALGEELGRTLHEIQLGKQRQTALRELTTRVRQSDLTSVINAIIQADELGVSIGQLLRIQGDQLRNKRFSRAEKLANEAPVKILFPVIVFIFPAVIVILMAPIIMQALKTLAK